MQLEPLTQTRWVAVLGRDPSVAVIGPKRSASRAGRVAPLKGRAAAEELDPQRLIYHLPKPGLDGRTQIILSPLELIGRIAALIPPPR